MPERGVVMDAGFIDGLLARLDRHPLYESLRSVEDLRVFMSNHVYSVWDFMSLVKYLQARVAPAHVPWQSTPEAHRLAAAGVRGVRSALVVLPHASAWRRIHLD